MAAIYITPDRQVDDLKAIARLRAHRHQGITVNYELQLREVFHYALSGNWYEAVIVGVRAEQIDRIIVSWYCFNEDCRREITHYCSVNSKGEIDPITINTGADYWTEKLREAAHATKPT